MQSCIYEGRVRHTRTSPVMHRFSYRLFLMYLDLEELPELFERRWLWSGRRPAIAQFRRSDHLGPDHEALDESVRKLVAAKSGRRPQGPVRLLTNLSYFGYCFNPVSFYYCFDETDSTVETIVAEVNNTPWGEQHCYVLECGPDRARNGAWRFAPDKALHVSPFMPMDVDYHWALSAPAERLTVYMANSRDGRRMFDAGMTLTRTEISGWSLASVLARFPFMTMKVVGAIYWQALRLWLKRTPLYTHPNKKQTVTVKS